MSEQPRRAEVTVRCSRCGTALARLTPTPAAFRWQVDRIERVPWERQPWMLGVSGLGDLRYAMARDDGTVPSPRMLPDPIPSDTYRAAFTCRGCGNPSTAKLRELRACADRAEAAGETVLRWP